jgi:hypothetical protein
VQVCDDILSVVQQDAPVLLQASNFNLDVANTDSTNISIEIDQKILKLAWHQICVSVFSAICTEYTNQPQAALDHIKQSYVDENVKYVCIPVFAYYQCMMSAMRPFADNATFPKSVCNALINGMDGHLLRIFKKYYTNHAILHNLSATFQRSCFCQILATMQMAEDHVHSISAIARNSIGGQAFSAKVYAFPSQAKCTLDHYSQGGYSSGDRYHSEGGRSESSLGSCSELG